MGQADHLARLTQLAQSRLGINLTRAGLEGALARFARRSFSGWDKREGAEDDDLESAAFQSLVDAVTVQHSWFFRDRHQLELACATLVQDGGEPRRQHVWVPACATGEDVYSIIALCEAMTVDVELLGTDVNHLAIEGARQAVYRDASIRHVPAEHQQMLARTEQGQAVVERHRRQARFQVHNLLDAPPRSGASSGKWDLIVCRNVLIYFTSEHTARALTSLRNALAPGGTLVLGASDILTELPPGLAPRELGGRLVFQRVQDGECCELPRWAPPPAPAAPAPPALHRTPVLPPVPPPAAADEAAPRYHEAADPADADRALEHMVDGINQHLAGDLHAAMRELRAALFLKPSLWPASYYLALTFEGLGRNDEARRAYAQVVEHIDSDEPSPEVDGHDFSFLRRDMAAVARRRAAR